MRGDRQAVGATRLGRPGTAGTVVIAAEPGGARFTRGLQGLIVVSGAVALVYQSLWMRQLSLLLGSTTYAVGTVLAAFMAGLGFGAWVLGRRADRSRAPLRLYAGLELAIGLCGLASPFVLAHGNGLYAACYAWLGATPGLLTLARFLIGFDFVAVPAILMGGTLPVAARYVVRRAEDAGRGVALLYALNTLGAALGALLLPFVLLPALGVRATVFACGVTNLGIALVAGTAAHREGARAPAASGAADQPRDPGLLAAFFVSGFVALALEVVWNRFFAMYVGSSIYSYAVILFLYLVGVVIGGLVFARLDRAGADPGRVFVTCLLLLVADLAITIPSMDRVFYLQVATLATLGVSFATFQLASAVAAALVILPPTVLLGVSFPAVVRAMSPDVARVGTRLGFAYLVNTAGTTVGALAASFVLIPGLGVRRSLDALALLAAAACTLAVARRASGPRRLAMAASWALACVPMLAPAWNLRLLHTTISKQPLVIVEAWRTGDLAAWMAAENIVEYRDGVDATVTVADHGDDRVLYVNGKPDASSASDMATQLLLGHLPLLLHPAPRDVLVVGMGSGVTLAAAARHPVTHIDLVEISAEVLDMGARLFRSVNRDVVHDPRVTLHVEDGRNFIAFDRTRAYDVIISEPSNPWMTGVANLFTDEFFAEVHARLRPGGILAQWFHYYSMDLGNVRTLVGTLGRHFAYLYVIAFHHNEDLLGDMTLVAADAPLDFAPVMAAFRGQGVAAADLGPAHLDNPNLLLQGFVLGRESLDAFVAGAPLNSDDRPRVELDAPRSVVADTSLENLQGLVEASGGARLPVTGEPPFHAFQLVPPAGFQRTFMGYRIELGEPTPDGLPDRHILREVEFEDARGRRLGVVSARVSDEEGLGELVHAVGAVPTAGEKVAVAGHPAVAYRLDGRARGVVAWVCPESGAGYAAVVSAEPDAAARILEGIRCHGGG